MRYRDLEGHDSIQPGDELWNLHHRLWLAPMPGHKYIGKRVDETGMLWRRPVADEPADEPAAKPEDTPTPGSKYHRVIRASMGESGAAPITVDVYDVLRAFNVTCPATQHAIKKLLCPGMRGTKSERQDIQEAIGSLHRALELMGGDDNECD